MDRKDFLNKLGLSTAAAFAVSQLVGCSKAGSGMVGAAGSVDFTIDLSNSSYSALNSNGGFIYMNGVIVARTTSGNYVALSQTCTHQGYTVQYVASQDLFYCPAHGSIFSDSGAVQGGPAPTNLKQYKTQLSGTSLRIYG